MDSWRTDAGFIPSSFPAQRNDRSVEQLKISCFIPCGFFQLLLSGITPENILQNLFFTSVSQLLFLYKGLFHSLNTNMDCLSSIWALTHLNVFSLQVTLCWNTMGWSSPPKTGIMTTRRTTAPPFTTAPGGTATATPPTLMASTCAGSTPPMRTASSGPPGLAGSTLSSSPRWRYDLPATPRINEKDKREAFFFSPKHNRPQILTARWSYLSWFCLVFLFFFSLSLKLTSLSSVDSAVCLLMSPSLFTSLPPSRSLQFYAGFHYLSLWFLKKQNNNPSNATVIRLFVHENSIPEPWTHSPLLYPVWHGEPTAPCRITHRWFSSWHVTLTSHLCWHGT